MEQLSELNILIMGFHLPLGMQYLHHYFQTKAVLHHQTSYEAVKMEMTLMTEMKHYLFKSY